MSDWTPVNEGLPDAETEVLVVVRPDMVEAAFWDSDCWRHLSAHRLQGKVTHWMPYPNPPEDAR